MEHQNSFQNVKILLEMERTEDGDDEKTLIFPQPFPT
jgi:hypothetical protein